MENKNLIKISGSTLIADCPLSTRVKSVLYYADIETIDDVLKESPHKLYRLRNFGTKSFLELNEFLIKNDFHFGNEKEEKQLVNTTENQNLIQISGSTFLADCSISTRIKHILKGYGLKTINDLLRVPPHKLTRFRNLGAKSIAELNEFLIKNDFHFVREKQSNYQGMRTKFDISDGVFKGATLKQVYKEYETNLEDRGWIFDWECKEIYTIIDREIYLNVGAEIVLYGLFYVVISKRYNVDEDYMHYELEAR